MPTIWIGWVGDNDVYSIGVSAIFQISSEHSGKDYAPYRIAMNPMSVFVTKYFLLEFSLIHRYRIDFIETSPSSILAEAVLAEISTVFLRANWAWIGYGRMSLRDAS